MTKVVTFISDIVYPNGSGAEFANYLIIREISRKHHVNMLYCKDMNKISPEGFYRESHNNLSLIPLAIFNLPVGNKGFNIHMMSLHIPSKIFNKINKVLDNSDVIIISHYAYGLLRYRKLISSPILVLIHDYFPICPRSTLFNYMFQDLCFGPSSGLCPKCYYIFSKLNTYASMFKLCTKIPCYVLGDVVTYQKLKLLCKADRLIFVSKGLKNIILQTIKNNYPSLYTCLSKKAAVCYNPLPPKAFKRLLVNQNEKMRHFSEKRINLLYNGGLSLEKGFHIILSLIRYLRNSKGSMFLNKISNVEEINIALTKSINRGKRVKNSSPITIKYYDRLPRVKYEKLLKESHILIYPSLWYEPFGYSILEALIERIPVITTGRAGIFELLGNDLNEISRYVCITGTRPLDILRKILHIVKYYSSSVEKSSKAIEKILGFYRNQWIRHFNATFMLRD